MSNIFVSYSHSDREYVNELKDSLTLFGFDVWHDEDIEPGERWFRSIADAIRKCIVVIVVMTPDAEASTWVEKELLLAQKHSKPILPLLLKGQSFDILINEQYADVRGNKMPDGKFHKRLQKLGAIRKVKLDATRKSTLRKHIPKLLMSDETLSSMMQNQDGIRLGIAPNPTTLEPVEVRLDAATRSFHTFILGNPGTGKSVLMSKMIAQDMEQNRGLCVIDVSGDLMYQLLKVIPPHRVEDIAFINLEQLGHLSNDYFSTLLAHKKICLVNLQSRKVMPKQSVTAGVGLLKQLLVASQANFSQAKGNQETFFVYIEEFHHFLNNDGSLMSSIFAKVRKYGLSVVATNASLSPLSDASESWRQVLSNTGNLVICRTRDAATIASVFKTLPPDLLDRLPPYHAVFKPLAHEPFEIELIK
ncbi:MAG TPA: TIR domain-containing protein [Aggregatilineales bacterium]|nr:TIR domain-containing protein [Aggregatilineales bacterium]